MNFITILSIFLIFSFQFSSLVSGGLIMLSESDSRLVKKNAIQNFFNREKWTQKATQPNDVMKGANEIKPASLICRYCAINK
jgi:hypothetical protein